MSAPSCTDCIHLQGTSTCGRPVPSYWNPATNQRRSRVAAPIAMERTDRKVLGSKRVRCGTEAIYFEPKGPPIGARVHDTIADSDGDDGS